MPFLMVHPMNSWKVAWDIFVSLLILYSCISVPLNVGFDIKDTLVLDIIVVSRQQLLHPTFVFFSVHLGRFSQASFHFSALYFPSTCW